MPLRSIVVALLTLAAATGCYRVRVKHADMVGEWRLNSQAKPYVLFFRADGTFVEVLREAKAEAEVAHGRWRIIDDGTNSTVVMSYITGYGKYATDAGDATRRIYFRFGRFVFDVNPDEDLVFRKISTRDRR